MTESRTHDPFTQSADEETEARRGVQLRSRWLRGPAIRRGTLPQPPAPLPSLLWLLPSSAWQRRLLKYPELRHLDDEAHGHVDNGALPVVHRDEVGGQLIEPRMEPAGEAQRRGWRGRRPQGPQRPSAALPAPYLPCWGPPVARSLGRPSPPPMGYGICEEGKFCPETLTSREAPEPGPPTASLQLGAVGMEPTALGLALLADRSGPQLPPILPSG